MVHLLRVAMHRIHQLSGSATSLTGGTSMYACMHDSTERDDMNDVRPISPVDYFGLTSSLNAMHLLHLFLSSSINQSILASIP